MLQEFMSSLRGALSNNDIYRLMQNACQVLSVDYFSYALFVPDSQNKFQCFVSSNVVVNGDKRFADAMLRLNPSLRQCLDSTMPVIWSTVSVNELPVRGTDIADDLDPDFIIGDGISLGVNVQNGGKGVISLAIRDPSILDHDVAMLASFLHIAAPYTFERLYALHCPKELDVPNLSKREMECLFWISLGKTSWETSKILGVSEKTIDFHVGNIVGKLDCRNRSQAVAKAMRYGLCVAQPEFLFDKVHHLEESRGKHFMPRSASNHLPFTAGHAVSYQ